MEEKIKKFLEEIQHNTNIRILSIDVNWEDISTMDEDKQVITSVTLVTSKKMGIL